MDTIVEKLKKYIDFKGIPVSIAEKEIGVSNSSLSKPFKAKTTIKTDTLEKFLFFYSDINPEWLLTGKGSMIANQKIVNSDRDQIIDDLIRFQRQRIKELEKEVEGLKKEAKLDNPLLYVAEPAEKLNKKY